MYAGLDSWQARASKQLQDENTKLKRLAAYAGHLLSDEYDLGACEDPEMARHISEGWHRMLAGGSKAMIAIKTGDSFVSFPRKERIAVWKNFTERMSSRPLEVDTDEEMVTPLAKCPLLNGRPDFTFSKNPAAMSEVATSSWRHVQRMISGKKTNSPFRR
jgi:hypothetical protein